MRNCQLQLRRAVPSSVMDLPTFVGRHMSVTSSCYENAETSHALDPVLLTYSVTKQELCNLTIWRDLRRSFAQLSSRFAVVHITTLRKVFPRISSLFFWGQGYVDIFITTLVRACSFFKMMYLETVRFCNFSCSAGILHKTYVIHVNVLLHGASLMSSFS